MNEQFEKKERKALYSNNSIVNAKHIVVQSFIMKW